MEKFGDCKAMLVVAPHSNHQNTAACQERQAPSPERNLLANAQYLHLSQNVASCFDRRPSDICTVANSPSHAVLMICALLCVHDKCIAAVQMKAKCKMQEAKQQLQVCRPRRP